MFAQQLAAAPRVTVVPGLGTGDAARALAAAALLALLLPLLPAVAAEQLAGWQPYHGHIALHGHAHEHAHPYDGPTSVAAGADSAADAGGIAFTPSAEGSAAPGVSLALPLIAPGALPTELTPPRALPSAEGERGVGWQSPVPTEPPRD